jgi:hypothetical protein
LHCGEAEVTTMTHAHRILAAATCLGALVAIAGTGCKRDQVDRDGFAERNFDPNTQDKSGVGTTTITGADLNAISSESAVERITVARCTRETACNNVGSDKHFGSYDVCARELRSKVGEDLAPNKCPQGIDLAAIDKCTEAIRTESCNNPVDTISRLATCRASALCLDTDKNRR